MNFAAKLYVSVNEKNESVKFFHDRYRLFETRNCFHCNTELTIYLV